MSAGTLDPAAPKNRIPPLKDGDRLTRAEFERRYEAMPEDVKAELIEGVVYLASPVRDEGHGKPDFRLISWLGTYQSMTPGVDGGANSTVRLSINSEPQPDCVLFILPECGGQVVISEDDYVENAPELAVEIAASSVSLDLGPKKRAYAANGIREYLVWRTLDDVIDWFAFKNGQYVPLTTDSAGVIRSEVFPGLWLNVPAALRRDTAEILATLQQGLQSPEHARFVAELTARRRAAN